jgi:hypothetical protein
MRMLVLFFLSLFFFIVVLACQEYPSADAGICEINGIKYYEIPHYDAYCNEAGIISYYHKKWLSDSIGLTHVTKKCETENADYSFQYNPLTGFFELTFYGKKGNDDSYYSISRGDPWENVAGHYFYVEKDFYSDSTDIFLKNDADRSQFFCKNLTEEPIDLLVQDSLCDKVFLEKLDEFFRHPCADGQ